MPLEISTYGILNPQEGLTRFRLERYPPAVDLAPFIERHWIVRWDLRGCSPYEQETLPHPCVNLVFEASGAAVHGVGTRRHVAHLEGKGRVVGVKFKPGGFFPWSRGPVSTLTERAVPLREALDLDGEDDIERRVLACEDDRVAISLVEELLRVRLLVRDAQVESVVRLVAIARDDPSIASVEALASAAAMTPRTLQRLFHRYVGVGPKWVIRRCRIHEAAERCRDGARVDWAALAHDLGYCDQPHFSREFKAQIGRTPSEYAAWCASLPPASAPPRSPRGGQHEPG